MKVARAVIVGALSGGLVVAVHGQRPAGARSIEELQALVRGGAKAGGVLEPSALCEASLRQQVEAASIGGNAIEVMFAIAKAVDPKLASLAPPGLLQGGGGDGAGPPSLLLDQRVQLTGDRITISSALDQLVGRVEGLGWWVAERCDGTACACRLGLVTGTSSVFSSYSISPPAPGMP